MSKIEIDVSERSLDDQINEACKAWRYANGVGDVQELLRDFAAGKFAKPELPEIVKPKWAMVGKSFQYSEGRWRAEAWADDGGDGAYVQGPACETERAAILAFNELFGGAS